jgi:DNA-directed RNA polymerase specialized sigma54-like protein
VNNPEQAQALFAQSQRAAGGKVASLAAGLFDVTSTGMGEGGTIPLALPQQLRGQGLASIIDVTYRAQEQAAPQIELAGYFSMQVPSPPSFEDKKTRQLCKMLINGRNWMTKTLTNLYSIVGETQQGFLWTQRPEHLQPVGQAELARRLDVNPSTVSRLIGNRYARVAKGDAESLYEIADLIPCAETVARYRFISLLNEQLAQEPTRGDAYADGDLYGLVCTMPNCDMAGGSIMRRTIAKWRKEAGIPGKYERRVAYEQGRTEPYRLPSGLERRS